MPHKAQRGDPPDPFVRTTRSDTCTEHSPGFCPADAPLEQGGVDAGLTTGAGECNFVSLAVIVAQLAADVERCRQFESYCRTRREFDDWKAHRIIAQRRLSYFKPAVQAVVEFAA